MTYAGVIVACCPACWTWPLNHGKWRQHDCCRLEYCEWTGLTETGFLASAVLDVLAERPSP